MVTLTAEQVAYGYGDEADVVDGLDLTIAPGRITALIGPNGSGKSTAVRLLAGLLRPRRGRVTVDGVDMTGLNARERASHIAVVPQSWLVVPQVTVESFVFGGRYPHLGFWRRVTTQDRAAVQSALERTGVAEWRGRMLAELSGGERQRVRVARAIAQEAPVLLCDEPTGSLDLAHKIELLEQLAELAGAGRTVLLVTHELNLASQFGEHLVVLESGRAVASGNSDEVLRPEVVGPVFGDRIHYARYPRPNGQGPPLLAPWRGL
ncbi:MAG: hypothetical protein CMJ85_06980 [Planctomycetes bacterium]|jgi:iron complex transport system ATP-binding protein|nr:hypothetical protein [Planctomycetota bacterium]